MIFNFGYVVMGIWIIAAILLCANTLIGYFRGFGKSLGSLAAILLAAVLAFIVSGAVCTPDSLIVQQITNAIMSAQDSGAELGALLTGLNGVLTVYLAMLIKPFVFTAFFICISILLRLISMLVCSMVPSLNGSKKGELGALIGILCGVLTVVMVLTPVVGTLNMVSRLNLEDASDDLKGIEEVFQEVRSNKSMSIFMSIGCGKMYDSLARVRVGSRTARLADEIETISGMMISAVKVSGIMSADNLNGKTDLAQMIGNDDFMDTVSEMLDKTKDSPILREAVAGVISEAAKEWSGGGASKKELAENTPLLAPIADRMMEVLESTTGKTVADDLDTVKRVVQIITESMPKDENGKYIPSPDKINYVEIEEKILAALSENDRMAPLADEVEKLPGKAVEAALILPEGSMQGQKPLLEDMTRAIADQVNKGGQQTAEQQKKQIAGVIEDKLASAGITGVDNAAAEQCAAGIIEQLEKAGKDAVTADDIKTAAVILGLSMPAKSENN